MDINRCYYMLHFSSISNFDLVEDLVSNTLKHKTSSVMRSNMPTSVIFWKLCLTNSKIHITTLPHCCRRDASQKQPPPPLPRTGQ